MKQLLKNGGFGWLIALIGCLLLGYALHALVGSLADRIVFLLALALLGAAAYHLVYEKFRQTRARIAALTQLRFATIESLSSAIDARDPLTSGHIQRVRQLVEGLARAVAYPQDQLQGLIEAALLHDIGKLAVPEHILSKPGRLSISEYAKVKIHPAIGADILSAIEFPYELVPIVKHHHERFDGKGYPIGLKGEEIPLGARILSIVDCYEALTTDRPYRPRYGREQALEIMRIEAGRAFDPTLLKKFFEIVNTIDLPAPLSPARPAPPVNAGLQGLQVADHQPLSYRQTRTEKALRDIAAAQQEIYSLYEISQTLGSTLKLAEILPIIAAKLENITDFTTLVISLTDDERLRAACCKGRHAEALKEAEFKRGEGAIGWVVKHRQTLVGGHPQTELEPLIGQPQAALYHSMAILPLLRGPCLIGVLALYSEADHGYSADEVRLLEIVAHHAAIALDNALAFERTRESALTDNLTGLPNSRYLYSLFDQERSRAERHGYSLALLMMDLDDFKKVNDTYGHATGDAVLRHIVQLARVQLRSGDVLVRYAGDEFVILLHRASPETAWELKDRLQSAIDGFVYDVRPGRQARVGVSIGYASYGPDGYSINELMEVADQRMYEDKIARKSGALSLYAAQMK